MGTLGARPGWRRGVLVARALPPPSAKMASGYIRYLFQKQPLSVLVGSTALLSTGGYLLKLSQARVNMRAHKIATEAGIERAEERAREAKVALSRGGPAQLAKLERELKAAKQAVDAAHK